MHFSPMTIKAEVMATNMNPILKTFIFYDEFDVINVSGAPVIMNLFILEAIVRTYQNNACVHSFQQEYSSLLRRFMLHNEGKYRIRKTFFNRGFNLNWLVDNIYAYHDEWISFFNESKNEIFILELKATVCLYKHYNNNIVRGDEQFDLECLFY
jgi:hypothetical protein